MKGKSEKGGTRYVVLRREQHEVSSGAPTGITRTLWAEVGVVMARTAAKAIEIRADGDPGDYRAFPESMDCRATVAKDTRTVVTVTVHKGDPNGGSLTAVQVVEQTGGTVKP